MAEYSYKAASLDGKTVRGRQTANNPRQLKEQLSRQELYLLECRERKKAAGKRLRANRLSDFCRELSSMLATGVTLVRAMQVIKNRDLSPAVKNAFFELDRQIKRGAALSDAMEHQGGAFPELLISMVKAGEANGRLDKALARMAEHYEAEHRTNQEIRGALFYPALLVVITVCVIVVVFTLIFPRFAELFGNMELPLITRIMMSISGFLTRDWFLAAVIALALVVGVFWLTRIERVRFWWDKLLLRLPRIGKLLRIIYTARFARTFSSLYSGGLAIIDALRISGDTVGNRFISGQFEGVIRAVKRGAPLSEALAAVEGFDGKLSETVTVGEETGRVDELLTSVAESFDHESSVAIKKLVQLIEPVMILIMALVIVAVMLSVMLPIYQLYGNIEQMNF